MKEKIRYVVGGTLLSVGAMMSFSSIMYVVNGDNLWFSRMVFAIIALGLWYVGSNTQR